MGMATARQSGLSRTVRPERALSGEARMGRRHGNCKMPAVPGAQQGSSGWATCRIHHSDVLGGGLGKGRLPAPLRQAAALPQRDRCNGAVLRQERKALLCTAISGGAPGQLCCLVLQQEAAAWQGLWLQCSTDLPGEPSHCLGSCRRRNLLSGLSPHTALLPSQEC